MERQEIARNFLIFQIRRNITFLFKRYLEENESLKIQHDEMIQKLKNSLPKEYHSIIEASDYYTDDRFKRIRKLILDSGNLIINNLLEFTDRLEIEFNGNYKEEKE